MLCVVNKSGCVRHQIAVDPHYLFGLIYSYIICFFASYFNFRFFFWF